MTNGYSYAKDLRDKEKMNEVPRCPGYYKWWAKKEELQQLLEKLEIDETVALQHIETKNFNDVVYYGVYVGIAGKSLRQRIVSNHIKGNTRASTLRYDLACMFGRDIHDELAVNAFLDNLIVEFYPCDAREQAIQAENDHLFGGKYLYVLNNSKNTQHPLAKQVVAKIKEYRKKAKQTI